MDRIVLNLTKTAIDPIVSCEVYKAEGCTKINSSVCNYHSCDIVNKFIDNIVDKMYVEGFFDSALDNHN